LGVVFVTVTAGNAPDWIEMPLTVSRFAAKWLVLYGKLGFFTSAEVYRHIPFFREKGIGLRDGSIFV